MLKSHSGLSKRVKITKKGKVIHKKAGKSHLLTNKWASLKSDKYGRKLDEVEIKRVKRLLPGSF